MRRRVVVTGIGILSPIGCTLEEAWKNALNGVCGIVRLGKQFENLPCRIAAPLQTNHSLYDYTKHFKATELKTMTPATCYALIAAEQALKDAEWLRIGEKDKERTGVAVGTGMVDLEDIYNTHRSLDEGYKKVSPFFVPRILPNMPAGNISIKYGFQGPNHSVSTACATGIHSIGDAFRFIKACNAEVMVCGGAEACITPLGIAGFCRLKALATGFNDNPEKASRPFDMKREGFVMGEGSAILVLEELSHAIARGVSIYAEILGYGLSGDASHITAPSSDGKGAMLAMQRAMEEAEISCDQVTYINAHATSTPLGDAIESKAIQQLFKENVPNIAVSSTKGMHGHLLGSAGNLEAAFTVKACQEGFLPPSINIEELESIMTLNYVANEKQNWEGQKKRIALKNSFGFGGTNASLCIAQYVK